MKRFTVTEGDGGQRFDRWAKVHLPGLSFIQIQKQLRKGTIRLDGKRLKPDARVEAGQVIAVRPEVFAGAEERAPKPKAAPKISDNAAKDMRKMVIHEDARCFVLNKPAGLAVQGGSGVKDSIDHRLKALVPEGAETPKLVHRIDKDTSGILVLARTRKAATELAKAFAAKDVEKTYWALVVGTPQPYEGIIDAPLEKLGAREKMEVSESGQRAVTEYRVVESLAGKLSFVELRPITGRTHQLRVHMASIGHPIYADGKYGGTDAFIDGLELPKQLHLHARRIVMRGLDITAPLSPHMRQSWKLLGLK